MQGKRLPRRQAIVRTAGVVGAAGFTIACGAPATPAAGTNPSGGSSGSSPTTAPAAGQPKKGGTLILGQTASIQNTNPQPSNTSTRNYRSAIFNSLVNVDEKQNPVAELAESWTLSPDARTLTLKLRQGVKMHSGKEFTAEEAKWNLDYAGDPKSLAQTVAQLQGAKTTAKDKYTVESVFATPFPQIYSLLAGTPVIDPASDLNKAVAGTGPFKLDSFAPGEQMKLVRHEGYWRTGFPLLDGLTIKVVPDLSSLLVSLRSGAIHAAIDPPLNEIKALASGATKIEQRPGAGSYEIICSAVDKPFDDKRVRQAVGLAIDRKRITEAVLFGASQPSYIMYPKSSPVWDASLDTGEFSLDKAKALLTAAGLGNGFETSIVTSSSSSAAFAQIAQIVQADLAKIGIKVTIQDIEANEYATIIRNGKFPGLATHSYGSGDQDPALLFIARPWDVEANSSRFKSAEYKRLVDAGQEEVNKDKRLAIYRDLVKLAKDEAFVLPIANTVSLFALRTNVQGFKFGYASQANFEQAWLG